MNYEQKKLVVRVFLPGSAQQVTDWEAVARESWAYTGDDGQLWNLLVKKHTTERPSRIDTGVDVVIYNWHDDGAVSVEFAATNAETMVLDRYPAQVAALGFPTEPQEVVETKAEGEVSP